MNGDGPPVESIAWAWWPSETVDEGARRYLLPVGKVPASKLCFDPDLWGMNAIFPDRFPIGTAGYERYLFFNPSKENVLFQERAEESNVFLVSSSVAGLTSSIAVYSAWYSRFLMAKDDPAMADDVIDEAARQLQAIERNGPNSFWPAQAINWRMQL